MSANDLPCDKCGGQHHPMHECEPRKHLTAPDDSSTLYGGDRVIPEKEDILTSLHRHSNSGQQQQEAVMQEQWRVVPGFPEYKVSDHGNVMSLRQNKLMKLGGTHDGYWVVYLVHEGNRTRFTVHRLVIMAFVGPRPEGLHIAHLDGNGKNNHVSNLKYVTQRENMRMRDEHGKTYRGEGSRSRVLSQAQVIDMRLSDEKSMDLARRYGVQYECILRARSGKSWKHLPMDKDELRAMQAEMADSDKHIERGIACTTGDHDLHHDVACGLCFKELNAENERLRDAMLKAIDSHKDDITVNPDCMCSCCVILREALTDD